MTLPMCTPAKRSTARARPPCCRRRQPSAGATEERLARIGGVQTILIDWMDNQPLCGVPVGQFADRVMAFLQENAADPSAVSRWTERNRHALREFWARAPGDALELKKHIEMASAAIARRRPINAGNAVAVCGGVCLRRIPSARATRRSRAERVAVQPNVSIKEDRMPRKPFSKRDLARRLAHFGYRCRLCQCEINGRSGLEWDHHIPLAIGGDDELAQSRPALRALSSPENQDRRVSHCQVCPGSAEAPRHSPAEPLSGIARITLEEET